MMTLAALTLMWGCGSSDKDDDNGGGGNTDTPTSLNWSKAQGEPNWMVDLSGNESAPQWTAPSPEKYETWMILMVTLQPELAAYSSEDDLMAIFISDELRALASPAVKVGGDSKKVTFILKILGNEVADKNVKMAMKYYNSKLKQMFTITGSEPFLSELVYGVEETYMPDLLAGCSKYPVHMPLSLVFPLPIPEALQPTAADVVAVMVDGQCRALAALGNRLLANPVSLTVNALKEGEKGTVYYYSARENAVWNTGVTVDITSEAQTVKVSY